MIKTFAFIDLETTGLPEHERNLTRITELSIVACSSEHLKEAVLPRVLHKLTICCNPNRNISKVSVSMTNLNNLLLSNEKLFDENAGALIDSFLKQLPPPVCLVAHNGTKFDYPLLQTHLMEIGSKIPESVKCCDSFHIFKRTLVLSSYKLSSIYQHLVGDEPPNAHNAEGDSMALLNCALRDQEFIGMANKLAYPSSRVNKLVTF